MSSSHSPALEERQIASEYILTYTYKHLRFGMDVIKMISGRVELMATALICQEAINVLVILDSRNW